MGLYTGFALLSINKINPYESLPISFLLGGFTAIGIYLAVLRPLSRRGASIISLMIATLAVELSGRPQERRRWWRFAT